MNARKLTKPILRLPTVIAMGLLGLAAVTTTHLEAQTRDDALPTIAEKTAGFERMDGFFPLYWDADRAQLWMEIDKLDTEVLHLNGIGAGLGSNDIGIDRGAGQGSRIVFFERKGRSVLLVQPNYRFRASSDNASEVTAVRDAFARSVLWSFTVAAESGDRVLVDLNPFLIRDATGFGNRMGGYRLEASRSSIYTPMTMNFPENTELEVELTFVRSGTGGGGRAGAFEGVGNVASTGEAASVRLHHSFVQLPDDNYEPRVYDPRSSFGATTWADYAVPLGEPMTKRFIRRHRLEKQNPNDPMGPAVEPIIYYLDPGAPEPVRSALLDGARWWNQAFEAAGFENAFRVEIRPDSISSHDIRYNVINWVHRSTRGWSTGGSVTDPRTGEIMKGIVTLGSLRVRQDYMIAEGLLSPYEEGDELPPDIAEWALARIRQLSAHEIGHTIGLAHNYYDSEVGRISVMDYPHPLVKLNPDGSMDYSEVYDADIGEWDKVAVNFGYRDFPEGTNEAAALDKILNDAWDQDLIYLTNQDVATHPKVNQWSNGTDAGPELDRMMEVRKAALSRFDERAIKTGMPMATMEEVFVPLYLHHRYQVEAAAAVLGGVDYVYALRGDGRTPFTRPSGTQQRAALQSLLATIAPSALTVPDQVVSVLPPRPSGFGSSRELFPRYTGGMFDAVSPAVVASSHTVNNVLNGQRAARLVEQHALDPSLPGLEEILDGLYEGSFGAPTSNAYEAEVSRAVERVVVDGVMRLADNARMPQVRAIAELRLDRWADQLEGMTASVNDADGAHYRAIARDIGRYMSGELATDPLPQPLVAPPGAPIGDPGMDWLAPSSTSATFTPNLLTASVGFRGLVPQYCSWDTGW